MNFLNKLVGPDTQTNPVNPDRELTIHPDFKKQVTDPIYKKLKSVFPHIMVTETKMSDQDSLGVSLRFGNLIKYYKLSFASYGDWYADRVYKYQVFLIKVDDSKKNKVNSQLVAEGTYSWDDYPSDVINDICDLWKK